jgi:hypothetical protein
MTRLAPITLGLTFAESAPQHLDGSERGIARGTTRDWVGPAVWAVLSQDGTNGEVQERPEQVSGFPGCYLSA